MMHKKADNGSLGKPHFGNKNAFSLKVRLMRKITAILRDFSSTQH
jgi:hypothetical protein